MRTYNTSYMLYLSDEQRDFIADKAKRIGVSSAQYCRMLIQKEIEAEKKENANVGKAD